jgi:hypothetical protein
MATFRTFNITLKDLDNAIKNVLGEIVAKNTNRTTAHKMAIVELFMRKEQYDARDEYVIRAAYAVIEEHGSYQLED